MLFTLVLLFFSCSVVGRHASENGNICYQDPHLDGKRENPGFKIRITRKGLDYASNVVVDVLRQEILQLKLADVKKSWLFGNVEAKNVRFTQLPRTKWHQLTLQDSWRAGVTLESRRERVSVVGDWEGEVDAIFTSISTSGTFSATGNTYVSMSAAIGRNSKGQPLMYAVSCKAALSDLSLKIRRGGALGWVMDLFSEKIADKLKPSVESIICTEAEKFVQFDFNAKMRTLPTKLNGQFNFDMGLISDPIIEHGSILISHKGKIGYASGTVRGGDLNFYPSDLLCNSSDSKMLQFYVSDYVLNSFLASAHRNQQMRYELTQKNFPKITNELNTSCPTNGPCLGTFLPELEEQYPNATASMRFETTADPSVLFTAGKAILNAKGFVKIFLHFNGTKTAQIFKADLSLNNIDVNLSLNEGFRRVFGRVSVNNLSHNRCSLTASNIETPIENFSQAEFQGFIDLAAPILEELANQYLREGIPIPLTHGISLRNVELRLVERTAQISADVIYDY